MQKNTDSYAKRIRQGKIGIMPTDTVYIPAGNAFLKKTVLNVYRLRKRNPKKPFIILISSIKDLELFNITPSKETKKILTKLWPNKISIVLPCEDKNFYYLHRGTKTLAFRLPKPTWLRKFLKLSGPIVAPSANPEGLPTAKNIEEAKNYFGKKPDFYWDKGELDSSPSTLVSIENGKIKILRQGAVKIDKKFLK